MSELIRHHKPVIWRDEHDGDQFHIGIKKVIRDAPLYIWYGTIFVDGLGDIFGLTQEDFASITNTPIEVDLKLNFYKE